VVVVVVVRCCVEGRGGETERSMNEVIYLCPNPVVRDRRRWSTSTEPGFTLIRDLELR
jgi:hypothetical protein